MSDVFISYSRKDINFARNLHKALKENKRDTWIDWQDIPPTAEWLKEIYSAIEGADTFVFVISPDSIVSEVCGLELTHAVKHNKRIVPIVYRDVDTKSMSEALARHNWIFFREDDDFDSSFRTLITAIDTDLDWVRSHTRLLIRAREWETNERNNSFLLRGNVLESAEAWLTQSAEKEPKPISLQIEYITSSRKFSTKRQRILLGAVSIGLVIAIVLGTLAFVEYRISEKRSQIALARQLSAQAEIMRNQSASLTERSVLLAVEAMKRLLKYNELSLEADQALRNGLSFLLIPVAYMKHEDYINAISFGPDGKYIATASWDDTARIWEISSGKEIAKMRHKDDVDVVLFSPDGRYIATASKDKTVCIWETSNIEKVAFLNYGSIVNDASFSPDGRYIAIASEDKTARIWETFSGKEVARMNHEDNVNIVSFSPDGRYIATASYDRTVRIWDTSNGREMARINHRVFATAVSFSPDSRYIATAAMFYETASMWKTSSGKEVFRMNHEANLQSGVTDVSFSPDGKYIATAAISDNTARIWEVSSGEEIARMDHEEPVNVVSFSPDGEYIATASEDKTTRIWETESGKEVIRINHDEGIVDAVSFSPDGRYIVTASDDTARIWETKSGKEVIRINHGESIVNALSFSPDGRYVATGGNDDTARIWEANSCNTISKI